MRLEEIALEGKSIEEIRAIVQSQREIIIKDRHIGWRHGYIYVPTTIPDDEVYRMRIDNGDINPHYNDLLLMLKVRR